VRLVIVLATFSLSLNAQGVRGEPVLKGRVRNIREQVKNAGDSTFAPVQTTCYDRQGRVTDVVYFDGYNSPPRLRARQIYSYDSKGQISKVRSYGEGGALDQVTRFAYRWNSRGQIIEELHYEDGQLEDRTQYDYNDGGDRIKETSFDDAAKISSTVARSFDEHHHVQRESVSSTQPGLSQETVYAYGPDGQVRELTHFDAGILEYRSISTFDEAGQLADTETVLAEPIPAEMNAYGGCGDCGVYPGRSTFKHDSAGRITQQVCLVDDQAVRLDSFSYDKYGNPVNAWTYRFDPAKTPSPEASLEVNGKQYAIKWTNGLPTTTYRYDSHGNWIEATTYTRASLAERAQLASVKRRIIAYY